MGGVHSAQFAYELRRMIVLGKSCTPSYNEYQKNNRAHKGCVIWVARKHEIVILQTSNPLASSGVE